MACVCTGCTKLTCHSIFLSLCSFNRIIIVPSFIKCDRHVSVSFLELCALRSWRTVHWSTKQIEQMFLTLCAMPHPTDSVCRICCEGLNWDSLLLLFELPEKLAALLESLIETSILFTLKAHMPPAPRCPCYSSKLVWRAKLEIHLWKLIFQNIKNISCTPERSS